MHKFLLFVYITFTFTNLIFLKCNLAGISPLAGIPGMMILFGRGLVELFVAQIKLPPHTVFVDGLFLTSACFSHRKACNQPAIGTTTCNQASKQTAAVFMILAHRAIPAVVVVCWLGKAERAGRTTVGLQGCYYEGTVTVSFPMMFNRSWLIASLLP